MYCLHLRIDLWWDGSAFLMTSRVQSSRPVSIRQHLMPLFNSLERKKVYSNIYNILTMEFRPFHALTTWKVHVIIFSFHATHFHTLLTPLDFRYVNAQFDFRYTMLVIFSFSHIAYHPPVAVCWHTIRHPACQFVNDRRRIVAVWVYWTRMPTPN